MKVIENTYLNLTLNQIFKHYEKRENILNKHVRKTQKRNTVEIV